MKGKMDRRRSSAYLALHTLGGDLLGHNTHVSLIR